MDSSAPDHLLTPGLISNRPCYEGINVVSNAIKYTPNGGSLRTAVAWENDQIKFTVSDNGNWIPQADLERVFEPFYRVPRQNGGRSAPNTGLGLALGKALVELHGGQIWVESEPGVGSAFHITMPTERTF